jgi:hypothetical protein
MAINVVFALGYIVNYLERRCLKPTRGKRLAAEPVSSSEWDSDRGPLSIPVVRIWPLALGPSPEERVVAKRLARLQRFGALEHSRLLGSTRRLRENHAQDGARLAFALKAVKAGA